MILEIFSDDLLISCIAAIVSCICLLPFCTSSIALATREAASFACSAFCLVLSAISSMDAVICWIALACSVEPCASAWLALATCEELIVTWEPASEILPSALRLSSTSFFRELPNTSSEEAGFTLTVRLPFATSSAIFAWYLMLSITFVYSSTNSPNSSFEYLVISILLTRPNAISFAASESCLTERAIVLISVVEIVIVMITETINNPTLIPLDIFIVFRNVSILSSLPVSTYALSSSPYSSKVAILLSLPELTNSISLLSSASSIFSTVRSSATISVALSSFNALMESTNCCSPLLIPAAPSSFIVLMVLTA